MLASTSILGMRVDVTQRQSAVQQILEWVDFQGANSPGKYVCVANVHMCMEAYDDDEFRNTVNCADLVVADGKPLSWAQQKFGASAAGQVRGLDLMLGLCREAETLGISIGFYGSTEVVLKNLVANLHKDYPSLSVNYIISPPYRLLTDTEDQQFIEAINHSGIDILFVGLGCPKQERWMATHKDLVHCVMLGVGAAFDFVAGSKRQAPEWMQKMGLEWLYRLCAEPKRLWKRYLKHNPRFVILILLQILRTHYSTVYMK